MTSPSLSASVRAWTSEEKHLIAIISKESFAESNHNTADWDTNYLKLTIETAEPLPTLPSSLELILYSRRFAKLLEETKDGVSDSQAEEIRSALRADVQRLKSLMARGQSYDGPVHEFKHPGQSEDDMILPVTFRVNAMLLLIGERSLAKCLPEVLSVVDVMGKDANWAAAGYACDKILSTIPATRNQPIAADYRKWSAQQTATAFFKYKTTELPSFRSAQRPHERATSLGAPVDISKGTVSLEIPPHFQVMTTASSGPDRYLDPTGNNAVGKKIVDFAKHYQSSF